MRLLIFAALFWLSAGAIADERYAPLAQMPMQMSDTGVPVIPAQVNRQGPFWFLLDTGATATTIRPPLVQSLNLPKMAAQVTGLQSMGGTLSADLFRLDSIHYGPLEARNVLSPSFERPILRSHPVMGVAGIDILRAHAVEFDFKANAIRMHQGFRGGRGWVQLPTRFGPGGYAFVPYEVGGVLGEAFIDTGATSTILNGAFVMALGLSTESAGVKNVGFIGGVEGARIPLYRSAAYRQTLGRARLPERAIQFADLPIFARLSPAGTRTAILGADMLRKQRFVMDYPGKSVWWFVD
jgi:predicted aspartyl protease